MKASSPARSRCGLSGITIVLLLMNLLCLGIVSDITAQPREANNKAVPFTAQTLESFLDSLLVAQMDTLNIPGLVISVVRGEEILLKKGYGLADLETKRPMSPDKTIVRIGSIGKVFTATAVMQLVEQGKLGLDDDVNQHLKNFQLDVSFPEPVRVKHLLTHTGGFDDDYIKQALTATEVVPLGQYLATRMPPRVMPAGEFLSYSNHGIALAGYLVEAVSGIPYEQYVREHILQPLEMHRTHYKRHVDTATGYMYEDSTYKPQPYLYINDGPAGAWDATAMDMAHFMISHLQLGRFNDVRILEESSARAMQQRQFTNDPRLPGMGYAFFLRDKRDKRLVSHGGAFFGFYAHMLLIPEERLGIFFAFNKLNLTEGLKVRRVLVNAFLERYFPTEEQALPQSPPGFDHRADRFTGYYRLNRYSRASFFKLLSLAMQFEVAAEDGALLLQSFGQPKPWRWVEVDSLLFLEVDGVTKGERRMAFREEADGCITHMYHEMPEVYDKIPWYEATRYQLGFLGIFILVFLSECVGWPAVYLLRRRRKRPVSGGQKAQLARWLAWSTSGLSLIFLMGLTLMLVYRYLDLLIEVPLGMIALLIIPLLTCVLAVGMVFIATVSWKHEYWSTGSRLYYSIVTLITLGFIWFLYYWNLLGFHF